MARVVWLTDIHLNFVSARDIVAFFADVVRVTPDLVLLGGDISEAEDVRRDLELIAERLPCPIAFVLGNHDFYHGSIRGVRREMADLCRDQPRLVYLTKTGPMPITAHVGLVGHDGWADARVGDYDRSEVMLNDYELIAELSGMSQRDRRSRLEAFGDEAAAHIRRVLPEALAQYREVVLLTHVPPLREACWHEGRMSDDEWSPHFTCLAMGGAILAIMAEHPDRKLTVLCGHTHGAGETRPAENIEILTGGAVYGSPCIQRVFEWGS